MKTRQSGSFHTILCVANAKLGQERTLDGRTFFVAPAVILKQGVLNGSQGPLFYPAKEISRTVEAWNHKPVFFNHPELMGRPASSCAPEVLETQKVGFLLNARVLEPKTGKLGVDVWLDVEKCNRVSPETMDHARKGEMMETSTGLFTDDTPVVNAEEAEYEGKKFKARVSNFRPDHLAILTAQTGAMSRADGAGFPRLNAEGDAEDEMEECPDCDGTGEVDGEECPKCKGEGECAKENYSPDQPRDEEKIDFHLAEAERLKKAKKSNALLSASDKLRSSLVTAAEKMNYSPDQPRDEDGKFAEGGGGGSSKTGASKLDETKSFNEWHGSDAPVEDRHVKALEFTLASDPDAMEMVRREVRRAGREQGGQPDREVTRQLALSMKDWSGDDTPPTKTVGAMLWAMAKDTELRDKVFGSANQQKRDMDEAHREDNALLSASDKL